MMMREWFVAESAGTDGKFVVLSRSGVPLVFGSRAGLIEFLGRHKPKWANIAPESFEPLGRDEFIDFLGVARTHSTDRRTHIEVDGATHPIGPYLDDLEFRARHGPRR
jgi:hypothetical protein